MKTPVIIAAFNEERRIAETLRVLPDSTEPIVAVNGSTDATAEIARSFGARVVEIEEQGKFPAFQRALGTLGQRALEPFIMLDADTHPLHPDRWHDRFVKELDIRGTNPTVVSGPVWFTSEDGKKAEPAFRSLFRMGQAIVTQRSALHTGLGGGQYGANQGVRLARQEVLDSVMALGHYWPMEDVALAETIAKSEGGSFTQLVNQDLMASTPQSDSFPPLKYYLTHGFGKAADFTIKSYTDRAAKGSQPFSHPKE
jgi:hypothetical protein